MAITLNGDGTYSFNGPNVSSPDAITALTNLTQYLAQQQAANIQNTNAASEITYVSGSAGTGNVLGPAIPTPPRLKIIDSSTPVKYNVGAVTEAYFGSNPAFLNLINSTANRPSAIEFPSQLFTAKLGTNKGMITSWIPAQSSTSFDSVLPAQSSLATGQSAGEVESDRYGFQFHYNPTTIAMTYGGGPDTDVNFEITGGDKFQYLPGTTGSGGQSTIAFDIPINRIGDMRWYDPSTAGSLRPEAPNDLYAPRMPTTDEQKAIWNKGTMYDVEALLAALLGYKMNTKFRSMTADIGWTSGRPVELYLGKGLQYIGFIGSLSVNHVQFNERMVPTFSIVSISFSRMPDYNGM